MDLVEIFIWSGITDHISEVVEWPVSADILQDKIFERPLDDFVVLNVEDEHGFEDKFENCPLLEIDGSLRLGEWWEVGVGTKDCISWRVRPVLVSERMVRSIWSWTLVMNFSWKKS